MGNVITAIVGMCGTGKSVAAKYIEETFNFKSVYFGGYILEEVKNRNLEVNRTNEKIVREDLRDKYGLDVVARRASDAIKSYLADGSSVIIDGLYSFSEYLYLKEKFAAQLIMLAVHTSRKLRYQRLGARKVRPLTSAQVDERDLMEIKNIEKGGPIAIADYHIVNDGTIQDLHKSIERFFNDLKLEKSSG